MNIESLKVGSLVRYHPDNDLGVVYEVEPRGVFTIVDCNIEIEKINIRVYWLEDGFVSERWGENHESYSTHDLEVLN